MSDLCGSAVSRFAAHQRSSTDSLRLTQTEFKYKQRDNWNFDFWALASCFELAGMRVSFDYRSIKVRKCFQIFKIIISRKKSAMKKNSVSI